MFKHKVDRKTWDDSHVSPLPKAKKIMPQLRTTSLATLTGRGCSKTCRKSFVWQWQSTSYPDQFRCPPNAVEVKELCFVDPQATGKTRVREVESNATLTKNAIVHLFVENSSCRKRSLACQSSLHGLRSRSTAWVRHRRCHWLPTFFDAAWVYYLACLP